MSQQLDFGCIGIKEVAISNVDFWKDKCLAQSVADTSHTLRKFIKMHVYQETVGKISKNENTYFLLRQGTKCKIMK